MRDKSHVPWHTQTLSVLPQLPGAGLPPGERPHNPYACRFSAFQSCFVCLCRLQNSGKVSAEIVYISAHWPLLCPTLVICYSCAFGPNCKCQMHSLSLVAQWTQSTSWKFRLLCQALAARGTTWNKVKTADPWCVWQARALLGIACCHSDTESQCWQPKLGYIWVTFKLQLDGHEWILQLSYHVTYSIHWHPSTLSLNPAPWYMQRDIFFNRQWCPTHLLNQRKQNIESLKRT